MERARQANDVLPGHEPKDVGKLGFPRRGRHRLLDRAPEARALLRETLGLQNLIGDDVGIDDRLQGRPSRIAASISSEVARRSLEAQNCSIWAIADARSSTFHFSISRSSCSIERPLRFARAFSARMV